MENSFYSVLPPLVAILMVVLTKRVLLSLGVGILLSAFMLSNFNVGEAFVILGGAIKGLIISDGALNTSNFYIISFLLILGIITSFISIAGGSRAFGDWAMKHVKSPVGAQLISALLGVIIFIDDYFNSLAVGQVARPITDKQKVSRAKLAYIIDSTSAPVCVISPVSSWGAYVIALIGTILATHGITEYSAFSAFIQMIPMNFYALAALVLVFIAAYRNMNLGSMKVHEERAKKGELYDPAKTIPGELKDDLPTSRTGTVGDLVWPILALFIGTIGFMMWTGYQATEGSVSIFKIFENTDVTKSLVLGGVIGLAVTLAMFIRQAFIFKGVDGKVFGKGIIQGIRSMLPAVLILLFAWTIVDLIGSLGTGTYLAGLVETTNLDVSYLPMIIFLIAAAMTFATGTSWGSFGILLPIAGEIAAAADISIMLPAMAAVLAGAVFGDHCSPISDTTILSSTGAGSNHIDHVMTQLPYALLSAGIALMGYLIMGVTGSALIGTIAVVVILLALFIFGGSKKLSKQTSANSYTS